MIYRQHITLLFSGPRYECKHEKPTFNVVGFDPTSAKQICEHVSEPIEL